MKIVFPKRNQVSLINIHLVLSCTHTSSSHCQSCIVQMNMGSMVSLNPKIPTLIFVEFWPWMIVMCKANIKGTTLKTLLNQTKNSTLQIMHMLCTSLYVNGRHRELYEAHRGAIKVERRRTFTHSFNVPCVLCSQASSPQPHGWVVHAT